jgi:hypothetical protein
MTKAMKIWGTTAHFGDYYIGEIEDVGKAAQSRSLIKIFTCDSEDESAEYLTSGIERGQLTLQCVFEGEVAGTFASLQEDFDDGETRTLEITYKNGAKKSIDAMIVNLETPGGAADGGHAQYSVTFQLSGTLSYTPISEVTV